MKLITAQDLLMGKIEWDKVPTDHQSNLIMLADGYNAFSLQYGQVPKMNDAYRLPDAAYGAKLSTHKKGLAIDADDDAEGTLWKWINKHLTRMAAIGFFFEDPRWTHGINPVTKKPQSWVHMQLVPPASGRRIYVPSNTSMWLGGSLVWDGQYDYALNVKR